MVQVRARKELLLSRLHFRYSNGTTTVATSTFWLAHYSGQHPLYPDLSYRFGCSTPLANHRLSAVISMALFDQIARVEAEHNPEIKQAIKEAQYNDSSLKLLFLAPLSIR